MVSFDDVVIEFGSYKKNNVVSYINGGSASQCIQILIYIPV